MGKRFERALLLCPEKYSLYNSFHDLLGELAREVMAYDVTSMISKRDMALNRHSFRFPFGVRKRWEEHFMGMVNNMILRLVWEFSPDLILIYNSVFLLPETCAEFRKRSKIVFFMGDSPFYTPQNNYYLACLSYADLILSPDSFWNRQLNTLGIDKTLYFVPSPDGRSYSRIEGITKGPEESNTEILYVGSSYLNSWGYKKALLMSRFTGFNIKIYGNSAWKRWFRFFPELQEVYTESDYIPLERLNRMFNLTKLMPVDGNPGILSGFHIRLFESLSAGVLPLIEYRDDIDKLLFRDFARELPLIRDYNNAAEVADYYLRNESERSELARAMHEYIFANYGSAANASRLSDALR